MSYLPCLTSSLVRFLTALSIAASLIFLSGCAIAGIPGQVKQAKAIAIYRGAVKRESPSAGPIIVVLYRQADRSIAFYDVLLKDGPYYLVAERGDYGVVAFDDRNRNFALDASEPTGALEGRPVDAKSKCGAQTSVCAEAEGTITIPTGATSNEQVIDLSASGLQTILERRAGAIGRVATLDEPMFAEESTAKGLWKPMDFVREGRTGVYFLEEYDPQKIPLLFIHGIGGSPRELRSISAGIDRTRFQPWFFHYPSGLSLDTNGWILAQLLEELRSRHGFERLFIVAHSMGGLVAASCLEWRKQDEHVPLIELVVTISTPWLGSKPASTAPAMLSMPSWNDVSPGSDFIKRLSTLQAIENTEYCLLFSHAGDSRFMAGGDDGTVTISSQLPYKAENMASFIYGFDENHSSILENKLLIAMIGRMALNKSEHRAAAEGLRELASNF